MPLSLSIQELDRIFKLQSQPSGWIMLKLVNIQFWCLASFIFILIYWNVCVLIGNRDATAAFLAFISVFVFSVLVVFISFDFDIMHHYEWVFCSWNGHTRVNCQATRTGTWDWDLGPGNRIENREYTYT